MDSKNQISIASNSVSIDADRMDRLIRRADGSAALLYLFILRCGRYDEAEAAGSLGRDRAEIRRAYSILSEEGLVAPNSSSVPAKRLTADETPQYDAADIKNKLAADAGFSGLVSEAQSMLGKLLSSEDTMKLYGIYDDLGLPSDVILHLINYCIRCAERRDGPGRRPTMRAVQRLAFEWEREGVTTLAAAEDYIRLCEERSAETGAVAAALQIRGRAPTTTEKEYINSWLRMGFKADAVAIAYDRTVTRTGRLSWKYMDSILKSWHGKGLHTPKEIEIGDSREPQSAARPVKGKNNERQSATAADLERMRRYLETDNK